MLNPIMKGALEKVQGIQEALLTYMINTTDMNNAIATVEEGIKKIKKYGDKEWFFFKDDGQRFITKDQSGQTIKYIRGKCLEVLPWKELDKLLDTIDKI